MSAIGDVLVTRLEAQDSNYSSTLNKATQETLRLHSAQSKVGGGTGKSGTGTGSLGTMLQGLTGMVGVVGEAIPIIGQIALGLTAVAAAAGTAAIAIGKFTFDAMNIAAPYDTLERTFAGIYGSADKAQQMMSFLFDFAQKSNFEFTALANSAKIIVMNGMKFGEYADSIQAIALRRGGTSEDLAQVTDTLTRLKAGDFAQAFENLRSFGVGKDQLIALGATFDKSGQFTGNIAQALELFKKIGAQSQGVVDQMDGGMEATLGNLTEDIKLMVADFGKTVFYEIKPVIDGIINGFNTVLKSGVIKDFVKDFMGLFNMNPSTISLPKIVASIMAAVQATAVVIKTIWSFVITQINAVLTTIKGALGPLGALLHIDPIRLGAGPMGNMWLDEYEKSYSKYATKLAGVNGAVAEEPTKGSWLSNMLKSVTSQAPNPVEEQIAKNTAKTAEHTKKANDLQRHILGGGDLGRMGVTPTELSARRGSGTVTVKVVGSSIDIFLQEFLQNSITQLKRQGAI